MNYKRIFVPNAYIFITIVTYNRKQILIDNIDVLRNSIKNSKQKYNYELIAIVVNYDHMHFIINPNNIDDYPKIIAEIKRYFTKHVNLKYSLNDNKEADIWQRRSWEHTIRDEGDLYRHLDYIHYNPMKHYNIAPRDWEYSSFKKFVEKGYYELSWCNFEDKHKILNMDCE